MWIKYGSEALPPAGREHLKTCPVCQEMIAETEKITDHLNTLFPPPMPVHVKKTILKKISNPVCSPDWFLNILTLLGLAIIVGINLDILISGLTACTHILTRILLTSPWYFFPATGLVLGLLIITPLLRKIL
jgi:hypothetical protein